MSEKAGKSPNFVVIGGGTGSFTILSALKHYVRDITALVNMADDGGSTGVLRDELGVLPPGDVRQCLVALSDSSDKIRQLFNYRFSDGRFSGHSFGNLFLSAVEKMTSNFSEAVELASEVLKIQGRVEPITLDECILELHQQNKKPIIGQFKIEKTNFNGLLRPDIRLQKSAGINPKARKAILDADVVVVAPGNLYSSLVPVLMVDGVGKALQKTTAKVVYITNLVNKPIQTKDFSVTDYVTELERFAGGQIFDYVLYNKAIPSSDQLQRYNKDGEFPVNVDLQALSNAKYCAIAGNFLGKNAKQSKNDSLIPRSLIRHDSDAAARALMRIYFS